MPSRKRSLLFASKYCIAFIKQIPVVVNIMEEIKIVIKDVKDENQIKVNLSNNPLEKRYSDIKKQSKTYIEDIKPKTEQEPEIIKRNTRKNIDPSGLVNLRRSLKIKLELLLLVVKVKDRATAILKGNSAED